MLALVCQLDIISIQRAYKGWDQDGDGRIDSGLGFGRWKNKQTNNQAGLTFAPCTKAAVEMQFSS